MPLSGLYVILDPSIRPDRPLTDMLKASAEAGVRIFQYRNKTASMKEAYADASALRKVASEMGVTFIVNDRCDLALAVDADGVHLGQGDLPYGYARTIMGPTKLIGLSTHNRDQVKEAETLKPDYIGFGPIFKPGSKQGVAGLCYRRNHRGECRRGDAGGSQRRGGDLRNPRRTRCQAGRQQLSL
jgi:thiamine-phosphate pyrophosphorylase